MQFTDVLSYRQTWNPETVYIFISAIYLNVGSYYRLIDWVQNNSIVDPRTDLLPKAAAWGHQIRSRVIQNCCSPRSQSITVLLYTLVFFNFFIHLSIRCFQYPHPSGPRIWTTPLDIVTSISRDLLNIVRQQFDSGQ